jgi:outer membrane protein assembly complex protein YaeT
MQAKIAPCARAPSCYEFLVRSTAVALVQAALLLAPTVASATVVSIKDFNPQQPVRLGSIHFEGNEALGDRALREALLTRPRRWFAVWREHPPLEPFTLRADLKRLHALYRSRGYYRAEVSGTVTVRPGSDLADVTFTIEEHEPIIVQSIDLEVMDTPLSPIERRELHTEVALAMGDVFDEERYDRGRTALLAWFRQRGWARVVVEKAARVDVRDDTATVRYTVDPGPQSVFGTVTVTGVEEVDPELVRREVAFRPGEPFRQSLLDKTRKRIDNLRLFSSVRLIEDDSRDATVDIEIAVAETERREIRLGLGYDTLAGIRGTVGWGDFNFFGGGRQLAVSARVSRIFRSISADLLQPHFPGDTSRLRVLFLQEQTSLDPFDLLETKLLPRLEWSVTPRLQTYAFYRVSLDLLSNVERAVQLALPDAVPDTSVVSGLGFGIDWNATDDLVSPTRGGIARFNLEPVGMVLGGDVNLLRTVWEGRYYQPLIGRLGAAGRFRIGSQTPTAGSSDIPLFERFYAGGIGSVRGYALRRVGPLASDVLGGAKCTFLDCDQPLGGRSLLEFSLELRHPITKSFDLAAFVDSGLVSLASWNFPLRDLQYGAGLGVRYRSVIGPLRVDLGFPFNRRGDDAAWQVYFAVGDTF